MHEASCARSPLGADDDDDDGLDQWYTLSPPPPPSSLKLHKDALSSWKFLHSCPQSSTSNTPNDLQMEPNQIVPTKCQTIKSPDSRLVQTHQTSDAYVSCEISPVRFGNSPKALVW